jgi:hypothetical protein
LRLSLIILNEIQLADKTHSLSEETRTKMAMALDYFIIDAIDKFIKGQKEHGGNIEDRDLDKEIRMEMIDSFWYQQAKLWKQLPKK